MRYMIKQDLLNQAFDEALKRYPEAEKALVFLYTCITEPVEPSDEDKDWAAQHCVSLDRARANMLNQEGKPIPVNLPFIPGQVNPEPND